MLSPWNALPGSAIRWTSPPAPGRFATMNADARVQAVQYYQAAGRSMAADLEALAQHPQGVVLLMPRLVALMKPVDSSQAESWPELAREFPAADAWYVHLLVGELTLARQLAGMEPVDFPKETAIGALGLYVSNQSITAFQPMNVNFGLLPPLGQKIRDKKAKNKMIAERALESLKKFKVFRQ